MLVAVTYVDVVVAGTVKIVLLFVLRVCMLRKCESDGNVGVVVVSAGHVGRTRGSGIVSSTADVLWMSVVHGMGGVGGVCEMSRGGVGGEGGESMIQIQNLFLTAQSTQI